MTALQIRTTNRGSRVKPVAFMTAAVLAATLAASAGKSTPVPAPSKVPTTTPTPASTAQPSPTAEEMSLELDTSGTPTAQGSPVQFTLEELPTPSKEVVLELPKDGPTSSPSPAQTKTPR